MARDIEEFLRKAAERRRQQQAQQQGQQGQAQTPRPQPPKPRPAPAERPKPQRPPAPSHVSDEEVEVIDWSKESVAQHVSRHISTDDIASHAAQLGEEVALADDKLVARLQQTFDHDLGRLTNAPSSVSPSIGATPSQPPVPGTWISQIRTMLATPQAFRQAIILSEILKRPRFD